MQFSDTLFRACANHMLMKSTPGKLHDNTKKYLLEIFIKEQYGRQKDIQNKYISKGLMVEEDSITLFSRFERNYYLKNEINLKNEYISGTPDLYLGESIEKADVIIDVKSSWDIFTFFNTTLKEVNEAYYWQLQSYMALTGAKTSKLAYCLVNTPEVLINDEKRKLLWKMGAISDLDNEYIEASIEIDKISVYDDIPINQRVIITDIARDDYAIEKLYEMVKICRNFLNSKYARW